MPSIWFGPGRNGDAVTARIDLVGKRFGRLLVVGLESTHKRQLMWGCRCDCGTAKIVRGAHLRDGKIVSWGCHAREATSARSMQVHGKHGMHGTREYNSWRTMRQRCYDENVPRYHDYGGRGIQVCDAWRGSFDDFYAYMGQRPPGHTLDRYPDNDGNYEPGNVRWATPSQQAATRRKARRVPK